MSQPTATAGGEPESESRRAEAAIRQEVLFSQAMIESLPGVVYFYDKEGRFLRWNRNFMTVSGYSTGEIARMRPLDFFAKEDWPLLQERIGEVFERGESSVELDFRSKDGSMTPYFFTGRRVLFDGLDCLIGMGIDISERKRAEQALRKSEDRYRSTLDGTLEGCQLIAFDWRYLYLNEAAAVHNRRPNSELLGRTMLEAWPGIDGTGVFAMLRRCMEERIALHEEIEFTFPDGVTGWFDVRGQPVPEGIFILSIDISERHKAEEQLQASHGQLRALAARLQTVREEQSTHIAREIHDVLGQQLTAIKLDLAWLRRRAAGVGDAALQAAIVAKLGSTSELVDTAIRSVQKVATELRPGTLDRLGLAAALEHEGRELAQRTGLRCVCELSQEPLALADPVATGLFRIVQEALTNVARHAQATEVVIRLTRDGGGVRIEIRDNGRGIPEGRAGGQSLGLLGMRERALLLGGRLDIEGRAGLGTSVTVTVPHP